MDLSGKGLLAEQDGDGVDMVVAILFIFFRMEEIGGIKGTNFIFGSDDLNGQGDLFLVADLFLAG